MQTRNDIKPTEANTHTYFTPFIIITNLNFKYNQWIHLQQEKKVPEIYIVNNLYDSCYSTITIEKTYN